MAELNYLVSSLKLLEDWQLVARIALIISIFIEGSRQCGYDGAAMARQYIISALEKAGVDRHKKYRAYLHGLRSEVVSVLREIFPNLIDLNLKSPRELKRMVTDTEYAASIQHFETKTISLPKECFPEALIALEDVIAAYYKLDDWQFISRISMVIQKFIEEGVRNGCDGISAAEEYIPKALDEAGINRYKRYRAYLHNIRGEVLWILYDIFPNIVPLVRPRTVEWMGRGDKLTQPLDREPLWEARNTSYRPQSEEPYVRKPPPPPLRITGAKHMNKAILTSIEFREANKLLYKGHLYMLILYIAAIATIFAGVIIWVSVLFTSIHNIDRVTAMLPAINIMAVAITLFIISFIVAALLIFLRYLFRGYMALDKLGIEWAKWMAWWPIIAVILSIVILVIIALAKPSYLYSELSAYLASLLFIIIYGPLIIISILFLNNMYKHTSIAKFRVAYLLYIIFIVLLLIPYNFFMLMLDIVRLIILTIAYKEVAEGAHD